MDSKRRPLFSIIIVCLNPGDRLKLTVDSVISQSFQDYEVIIKDGLSQDGSLLYAEELERTYGTVRLISKKDKGIYDAMNQAAEAASGSFVYFLNCGDFFYSGTVLSEMAAFILGDRENNSAKQEEGSGFPESSRAALFYGDIFERLTKQAVASNPHIDAFGCYRNVPCHQACFYERKLLLEHPFETRYRVRADYEQFLWCFFKAEAAFHYTGLLIADYEGGGYSETGENRKLSKKEHGEIVKKYMTGGQAFCYRLLLWLTLAPLRTMLAENEKTARLYQGLKSRVYRKKESEK